MSYCRWFACHAPEMFIRVTLEVARQFSVGLCNATSVNVCSLRSFIELLLCRRSVRPLGEQQQQRCFFGQKVLFLGIFSLENAIF
jgi:hypothetical protein